MTVQELRKSIRYEGTEMKVVARSSGVTYRVVTADIEQPKGRCPVSNTRCEMVSEPRRIVLTIGEEIS